MELNKFEEFSGGFPPFKIFAEEKTLGINIRLKFMLMPFSAKQLYDGFYRSFAESVCLQRYKAIISLITYH